MHTPTSPMMAEPASFDPIRTTALVAGVLYLRTFLASIPAVFLMGPVLTDPTYVLGAGADNQVTWGLPRRHHGPGRHRDGGRPVLDRQAAARRPSIGFVASRGFEAAVIAIGVVSVLAVVTLRQPGATGVEATSLVVTQRALVAVKDWTFMIGPGDGGRERPAPGHPEDRLRLVPRIIPTLGLIGAPLYLSAQLATAFGFNETTTLWSGVGRSRSSSGS